jgi:sortase B
MRSRKEKRGGKRMEEQKKKRSFGDVIRGLVLVIALGVFCYSGYQLLTIYLEYKKGTDEYSALEKEYVSTEDPEEEDVDMLEGVAAMKNPIDFDSLTSVNSDIIGWLKVEALDISYPLAQGEDNEYYLHHTFQKTDNFAGCLFIDCENSSDFSDRNTIIYGHNMKNLSMFGKLKQFREDGVIDKSRYFWVYTPDYIYKYEIFACHDVGSTSKTYQLTFEDDQDFMDYIKEAFDHSVIQSDASVSTEDEVVTLSTCNGNESSRFIVQGKKIETYVSLK